MVLALDDKWIWDFWLARDGDDWHIFFLQADKSLADPELRHRNVSIGHAQSRNLRDWEHLGTCFGPAEEPAWDDWTTWTGSVVADPWGRWHLFYTGTRKGAEKGLKQRIGHAVSTDLHNWKRINDGLALDLDQSQTFYEEYTPGVWMDRAMRDPHVVKDPSGPGWLMYFTARVPGHVEPNAGGAIGCARSRDLHNWSLLPPVFAGGLFGQMEVPQVFQLQGRYYMLFCTAGRHWSKKYTSVSSTPQVTGTHYLMASDPLGPWKVAPGPFLDGATPCKRYAGKVVLTDDGPVYMAFLDVGEDGRFVGEVCDPIPVGVRKDGTLFLNHAAPSRAWIETSDGAQNG